MNKIIITPLGTVSPYCKGTKNCPGYLIEYRDYKYLFDCGNGITRMLNFPNDLNKLKIFISHLHPDHFGDLPTLFETLLVYKRLGYISDNIDVYIPNKDIRKEIVHFEENPKDFDDWGYDKTITKPSLVYEWLKEFEKECPINIIGYNNISFQNNDLSLKSLEVPHQISSYAFRIDTDSGSLVYSGDTGTKNNLRNFAKDTDLFICESTYLIGQTRSSDNHLYAHEAASIAKDANVKELLLTHFWPEIDKELYLNEAKEIFDNTLVAEEGKKLILRRYK